MELATVMRLIESLLCAGIGFGLGWAQAVLMRNHAKAFMTSLAIGSFSSGLTWWILESAAVFRFDFWGRTGISSAVTLIFLSGLSYMTRTQLGNRSVTKDEKASTATTSSQKAA